MTTRVVLGCGTVGRTIVNRLRDRGGDLVVLSGDEHRVETLRNDNVAAKRADVSDAVAVRREVHEADTVFVAGDDPGRNRAACLAAREVFPDAFLLAYTGVDPTPEDRTVLADLADDTVDVAASTAGYLVDRVGDAGLRTRRLRQVLGSVEGTLCVVAHDNPDPDAIASAVALGRVAEHVGGEAEVCYYGDISHQENRALVNLLAFELTNLGPDADLSKYGGFALVDHSRPGVNDQLPRDTEVDVVIDHHPPRAPVEARFVDLRSDVGATSTLLTGYLEAMGLEPDRPVATGLLFGIRVDTDDFSREVSTEDFEAAAKLVPHVDTGALDRIESPSVSPDTLDTMARAIANREVTDGILTTCVGELADRDALAQAADRLLDMEGVRTTLVYGYVAENDTVYASARARGADLDLGEALREAFGQIGSAGGHADMAGAQIPAGMLVDEAETGADRIDAVRDVVTGRFFETVGVGRDTAAEAVYAGENFFGSLGRSPSSDDASEGARRNGEEQ